jgi:hypothetical protein
VNAISDKGGLVEGILLKKYELFIKIVMIVGVLVIVGILKYPPWILLLGLLGLGIVHMVLGSPRKGVAIYFAVCALADIVTVYMMAVSSTSTASRVVWCLVLGLIVWPMISGVIWQGFKLFHSDPA